MEFPCLVLDVLDDRGALRNARDPCVSLAAEQLLQAAVGIGLRIDVRLDAEAAEDDACRRKSDAPFGEYPLSLQILQAPDLLPRHDVDVVVKQTGDVPDALGNVRNVVFGLRKFQRVGRDEAHVDVLQAQDVDEVLDRALAEDRQHPELVAVVEHRGHVGAHDRHRPADRRRDYRDRAGIEKIALGQFVALSGSTLLRTGGACEQSQQHANGDTKNHTHEIPHQQFSGSNATTIMAGYAANDGRIAYRNAPQHTSCSWPARSILREMIAAATPGSLRSCTSQSEIMTALSIANWGEQDEQRVRP